MWPCYGVHITVWHSCLCTLSASAFIDSSLHQLEFFLEIFLWRLVQQGLQLLFGHFNKATPSCGFYYYLVLSILQILSLVLFTIAAKRYKLRERERCVNIQAIAEEHYERYLDQEEEYMREAANMSETIPQIESIST